MGLIRGAGDENKDAATVDGNLSKLCRLYIQPCATQTTPTYGCQDV